jgi:integrase
LILLGAGGKGTRGFRRDLRHSFATLWIESGESAEVLQKVLGHSSIATTINTYSHLSPRYQRESFGRFGNALGGR